MRPAANPIVRAMQEIDRQIERLQTARTTLGELIADQFNNAPKRRGRPRKQVGTIVIDGGLPRVAAKTRRRRARKA